MASNAVPRRGPGELEGEVLTALYAADAPLTPSDVQQALGGHLAYTTVLTILTRLHAKGVARRLPAGRGYAYSPAETGAEHTARQMRTLLEVGTDRAAVLAQFVDALSPEDERVLQHLIARHEGALADEPARPDAGEA